MLALLMLNRMAIRRRSLMAKEAAVKPEKKPETHSLCCRTCLSGDDLVAIFYNPGMEKKKSDELRLVTGLEIRHNDGLSQKMCKKCVTKLNSALSFRRTSKKAEKALMNSAGVKQKKKITRVTRKTVKLKSPRVQKIKRTVEKMEPDDDMFDDFQNDFDFEVPIVKEEKEDKPKVKPLQKKPAVRKRRIPRTGSYKCGTCGKEFRMLATYKAHTRFHTNYCVCEACGKRCRNNNQLQEHKRARHGLGRIHKCAYCEYSSATKEALTIHERRHTGERPYICDHCGASFHRRSNLVQHIAIHLPEKNFQCDLCPKRLKSRKFLQIHKHNAHTGRRYGYLCPVCAHRFEKPNKVRAHARRVHGLPDEQQPAICSICFKREKSKKLLQVHVFKAHREKRYRYICPVCRDTFTRPGNVRQHLARSHNVPRHDQGAIDRFQVHMNSVPGDTPRVHTYS